MKKMWNDYVGIPYKLHGRDIDGLDCWGLARLIYKDQKDIDLPSLSEEYFASDDVTHNQEVIARHKEGWALVNDYTVGDVALFRINGSQSHVGVIIDENRFIHAREGNNVTIEKLDSIQWRRRLVGVYKYTSKVEAYVHAAINPLKTLRLDLIVTPGQTLQQLVDGLQTQQKLDPKIFVNHILFVDGYPVSKSEWATTKVKEGQHIDYRVVPTGDVGRIFAAIAIMVVAFYVAPYIVASLGGAAATATTAAVGVGGLSYGASIAIATMGVNIVGSLLVNALFPIRPPEQGTPGAFRNTNLIQGGSNRENPYGSIPVILGRIRYTPPVGAKTFVENDGDTSYLRMLAVWGYGPLQVTDMKLGNVPLSSYDEIEYQTLYGTSEDSSININKFNAIYGQDVTQQAPNLELECKRQYLTGNLIITGGNTFEATVDQQGKDKVHDLQLGDPIQALYVYLDDPEGNKVLISDLTVTQIISETTFKCQSSTGGFTDGTYDQTIGPLGGANSYFTGGNPWNEFTIGQEVDRIGVTLSFPQGLYGINAEGNDSIRSVDVSIQLRPVGETTWNEAYENVYANSTTFSSAFYNIDNDAELEPVYQWHYINVDSDGNFALRSGSITNNKNANPSGILLTRLQESSGVGFNSTFEYLPATLSQEETVYKVCVYGNVITDVVDTRSGIITSGCASNITPGTGLSAAKFFSVGNGTITRISQSDPQFDLTTSTFHLEDIIKYGYSKNISFNVSRANYEVRVKRTSSNTYIKDTTSDTCVLSSITGYTNTRPINLPKDSYNNEIKLARSALKIRSTGQVNGLVEGVTATVQTIGEDYVGGVWVANRPIRNPAALFRHVLKHPGNAKASSVLLDDASINAWYDYCKTNAFNFDKIILDAASLLEVLKDIAAAGRASPTMVDGKWSVVVDVPKTIIAQHFTPHNSWGFEGTRSFPQLPHAFRVNFNNQSKGWQADEMIVYNDGYTSANSTLFETIELPGVTEPNNIYKHARFHLAQLKLRPESYTLNVDIEHVICTRGDRVKVVHDVPVWGVGSARVTSITASAGSVGTILTLDESLPMVAGTLYAIRIRKQNNASFVKNVRPVITDGYYNQLELVNYTSGTFSAYNASSDGLNPDDLVLFGEYTQESVDLLVQSIEPAENMSARLTLVDYSPDIYTSDSEVIPAFDSQITKPAALLESVITYIPTIDSAKIISDDKVMEKTGPSSFVYKMLVPVTPLSTTNASMQKIKYLQGEIKLSTGKIWQNSKSITLEEKGILFSSVVEGASYDIRVRYVSDNGKVGAWSTIVTHTVLGKTVPPAKTTGLTITPDNLTGKLILKWNANTEIDLKGYEIRTEDTNWGVNDSALVFSGSANTCTTNPAALGVARTFYLRALDFGKKYSVASASASYTVAAPSTYAGTITFAYADTSTTDSTVTLKWTEAAAGVFAINKYELTITKPGPIVVVQQISGLTWTTAANWVGDATVTIKSVDILGNKSTTASTALTLSKLRPNAPASGTFTIVDSQLYLDWADVSKTSLPFGGYEIRKNNGNWGTNDSNLVWKGSVSNAALKNLVAGVNTFYINTFDTDNIYAASGTTLTYTVQRPAIVTGLSAVFSDTSNTNALVKFDWIAPAVTTFGIKKFIATLTKPGGNIVTASLDSTTWTVNADWVGTAALTITTVDMLDFTSATNATLDVIKLAPNQVGVVSSSVSVNNINVSWTLLAKTTLPVAGYEIRVNDAGWGTSSGLTWRGSTNTTSIGSLSTGSNVFYIRAFDTEGVYSETSRSFDLAVTAPLVSTLNSTVYANTSTSGTTITFNWTGNKGTFNISSYNLTLTKPGSIVTTASVSANTWTTSADWIADATLEIVSVDSSGNTGATLSTVIAKVRPTAPTTVTTTTSPTGLTIAWNEGVKGSLPIAGYELRDTGSTPGGTDYIWKGTASSVTLSSLVLGANTWDLWAFDTDLRYSAVARAVSYTAVKPSNPQTLSGVFNTSITNSLAEFKWVKPSTSVFGINRYEVSLVTTGPDRTINSTRLTTDWAVPADWLGDATLYVTAYDNLGFASNAATFVLAKLVPSQPGAFLAPTIKGSSLSLDWPDTVKTSLPIVGYELRTLDTNWGGTGFIWKGSASNALVDMVGVQSGTTSSWYLRAYDSDNRYSTTRLYQYTVSAPVNTSSLTYQFVDTSLTSATVSLRWLDTTPVFGLKHYEITGTLSVLTTSTAGSNLLTLTSTKGILVNDVLSGNANIPAGRKVIQILSLTQLYIDSGSGVTAGTAVGTSYNNINYSNSTSITQDADWLGNKNYTIKTVDLIGNKSTGTSISITKAIPNAASNLKAQVIDNTVLLYWDLPQITSLPISHVLIKKGATWNTASIIGTKSGTFTTVTEIQGGVYTYWIAVVDTDNNESVPISLTSSVSQPPDYIFNAEYVSTFTGTKSNAIIEANTGYLVLPVDTVESFSGHFTTRSWTTPDNQIAAGFPIYIQPGTTSGYYEEVFDYGSTLGSSQVTISLSGVNIAGSPDVVVLISTSLDGITYTSFPTGTSAFATNFRYIKVRITATQVTSGNIYSISGLVVRLDAKQRTDSGNSVLAIGAAHAQGSVISDYYTWVAGMTMPPTGYSLNGTSAENAIVTTTGPSGLNERLWACIDTDIASDADGGWNTTYNSIDSTKGYLFAVFVRTNSNNGTTWLGTSTNNTILDLSGTVNASPYFISGIDLPALNTWYLLIGYVYPNGYGTTDGGISGVYNLSGTKLVSGTSFKFNTGATSVLQRCYHYYNTTGTGTQVQHMARPVVIQCDAADASSKISYLLKCVNNYGATVVPNINYVDVTSITTTPNSVDPTTTVVDFYDKPYPTRFNIFNYNSAGVSVGGTISWTIRGY